MKVIITNLQMCNVWQTKTPFHFLSCSWSSCSASFYWKHCLSEIFLKRSNKSQITLNSSCFLPESNLFSIRKTYRFPYQLPNDKFSGMSIRVSQMVEIFHPNDWVIYPFCSAKSRKEKRTQQPNEGTGRKKQRKRSFSQLKVKSQMFGMFF